jgi:predicted transcriptional regulator of viral defense system
MSKRSKLFDVADSQQGYFTSKQAEESGIPRSHFNRKLRSGEWAKEQRGIYRLVYYPIPDRPELVLWTLWSRDRQGIPQGVWSHETALDIHDLSDVMPAKMHMTVPSHFRKHVEIPKHLRLHFANLAKKDMEVRQGYCVTTPMRTLLDVIEEGTLAEDLIIQAIREGIQKGILFAHDLRQNPKFKKYEREYKI